MGSALEMDRTVYEDEPIVGSCWEDGPRDSRGVGSTCMLPAGHDSEHAFTPDDEIEITFTAPSFPCECWSQPHAGFCPAREGTP